MSVYLYQLKLVCIVSGNTGNYFIYHQIEMFAFAVPLTCYNSHAASLLFFDLTLEC